CANREFRWSPAGSTPISLYTVQRMRKVAVAEGSPHGVVDGVFGVWPSTFERSGGGGEGVRGQDRRYRTGRRRTGADRELRGLRPRDEARARGHEPRHDGPAMHGV